uniref:Uncharacterized protein n=1 Tax=Rhizophora mucronata TaxID=61149 RepID=A0A2P2QQR3_RHIMU
MVFGTQFYATEYETLYSTILPCIFFISWVFSQMCCHFQTFKFTSTVLACSSNNLAGQT